MARKRRKRPSYDDKFRASAVVMLKSQGYPAIKGSLTFVARHLAVPARTLSRWFNGENNPPPDNVVSEKTFDMRAAIQAELEAIVKEMPSARPEASYSQLGTVWGILFDKQRLLDGLPTEIVQVTAALVVALKAIELEPADVFNGMLAKANAERERRHANG
jgi:transposase-like protein